MSHAIDEVTAAASVAGQSVDGVKLERYRPGLEMIIGGLVDPTFGPLISVGIGGVLTELLDDVVFAPAPVDEMQAMAMIGRLRSRALLDGFRGAPAADVEGLARIVSLASRGMYWIRPAGGGDQSVDLGWRGLGRGRLAPGSRRRETL